MGVLLRTEQNSENIKMFPVVFFFILLSVGNSSGGLLSDVLRIDVDGAIERFMNAASEYYAVGGVEALTRGFQIDEGTVFVNRTLVFGQEDAEASEYNVGCFRIPAVVQTSEGVLLAFAEGRIDSCHDCAVLGIAMKRSLDGGQTWSQLSWPVLPYPIGEGYAMDVGGNPTVVFDSIRRYRGLLSGPGTGPSSPHQTESCLLVTTSHPTVMVGPCWCTIVMMVGRHTTWLTVCSHGLMRPA